MDDNIIAAMEGELSQLEAKAAAIRSVIALYRTGKPNFGASVPQRLPATQVARSQKVSPSETITDAILRVARRICGEAAGRPVSTVNILAAVEDEGIGIDATVPRNVISSALSRSSEFVSNGRIGWTLAENETGPSSLDENGAPGGAPDAGGGATPPFEALDL